MTGYNVDVEEQLKLLEEIILNNNVLSDILFKADSLGIENYFIVAGCVNQTVWNFQNENDSMYGISDIDFVYFDNSDLCYEAEDIVMNRVKELFSDSRTKMDVKNQARVHLWYPSHFGYGIPPYTSLEAAINTWPTTASAVGVRMKLGKFIVYAPFGLNDLFGQVVRANKAQITKEIFENKALKWKAKWPGVSIIPW